MAGTVLPKTIKDDSKALFALGIPKQGEYDGTGKNATARITFIKSQSMHLTRAEAWWVDSFTEQAELLDASLCLKLHEWMLRKRQTFQEAIQAKRVLHFDILVLGIVSANVTRLIHCCTKADRSLLFATAHSSHSVPTNWPRIW